MNLDRKRMRARFVLCRLRRDRIRRRRLRRIALAAVRAGIKPTRRNAVAVMLHCFDMGIDPYLGQLAKGGV